MVETAAHLSDHVLPLLPLRQWVLSIPKRLHYFLPDDVVLRGATMRPLLAESTHCVVLPQSGPSRLAGASQPPAGLWAEKTFRAQAI